jgi:ribosomal protection tetracycline resistance protein
LIRCRRPSGSAAPHAPTLVPTEALRRAGTRVHEPMHRFRVEAPVDTLGALLPVPAGLSAVPRTTLTRRAGG